jgi:hypothetical protein
MVGSRRLTDEQRAELLEQAGHTCSACGATLTSLQIAHVVPLALGGSDDLTNLTVLCQACHARLDLHQPRETEFIEFLAHLIERHPAFEHVQQDSPLGRDRRYRADITAVRRISATPEHLVIECKRDSVLSGVRTRNILEQLREYRRHLTHAKLVLAFPGRASDQDMGELSGLVEIWDIDRLSELFRDQLTTVIHPYFTPLFAAAARRVREIASALHASQQRARITQAAARRAGCLDSRLR